MGEILPGKRGGSSLHLGVILGWRRYLYSVEIGYPNMVGNSGRSTRTRPGVYGQGYRAALDFCSTLAMKTPLFTVATLIY